MYFLISQKYNFTKYKIVNSQRVDFFACLCSRDSIDAGEPLIRGKIRLVSRSRCKQASSKMTPVHRRNWLLAGYFSENASAYLRILADAFLHFPAVLRPPCLRVLLKQVYFNGIESLPFLSLTALLLGFAASSRLYQVMSKDLSRTVDVFRSMIVQEGAVLVVAF